jgi:hypothetical protein
MIEFPKVSYATLNKTPVTILLTKTAFQQTKEHPALFQNQLNKCTDTAQAIIFRSITKKSILVVPCNNKSTQKRYFARDIAEFVRYADTALVHAFWQQVGLVPDIYFADIPSSPFLMHTHGHDVPWLHFKFSL